MRNRSTLIAGTGFLAIALLLGTSQLSGGGQRPLLGILLAVPWALAGVAIMMWPRFGSWLGAVVAAIALAGSVWILSLATVADRRGIAIAEQLFATADGSYSWAGVAITTLLYALAFACALGAAVWLAMRQRRQLTL